MKQGFYSHISQIVGDLMGARTLGVVERLTINQGPEGGNEAISNTMTEALGSTGVTIQI